MTRKRQIALAIAKALLKIVASLAAKAVVDIINAPPPGLAPEAPAF